MTEYRPDIITKIVSSVIGVFSPQKAVIYQAHRFALSMYAAGKIDGPNARWNPSTKTADEDYLPDKQRIINRCRKTAREDMFVSGGIKKIAVNVVRTGQKFQANVTKKNGSPAIKINKKIEKELIPATKGAALDLTGHDSIYALQRLALRTCWTDGQLFARRFWVPESKLGFKIEMLKSDQLDAGVTGLLSNGNIGRAGIEFYPDSMKPAAYHFRKEIPEKYSYQLEPIRIEAKDIIHVFDREEIGQTQGVPWIVSIVMEAFNLSEFRRYESIAAKTASAFAIFLKAQFPDTEIPEIFKTTGPVPDYVEPGRIQVLPYGAEIDVAKSDRPSTSFGPWMDGSLQGQSSGVGLSYGNYSNNRAKSSYSSERSGGVEEKYSFRWQQDFLNGKFNFKLWQWIVEAFQIKGMPVSVDDHGYAVEIQSPGWESIDQKKDAEAVEIKINNGTGTRKAALAKEGIDYDENLTQLKKEKEDYAFLEEEKNEKNEPAVPVDNDEPKPAALKAV